MILEKSLSHIPRKRIKNAAEVGFTQCVLAWPESFPKKYKNEIGCLRTKSKNCFSVRSLQLCDYKSI